MSTPYELPVGPEPLGVGSDAEPSGLPDRPALRVVGDDEAEPASALDFDDFVRRQSPRLRRLIMRKLGDPGEAEEIAQETLLRAHQHLHTLRTENDLVAWTTVVGQRLAIDRIRVRGRSVAVAEVPEDYRVGRDTADIVVARAEARTALESLEAIPERQAAILWAREVEGLQYDAIAERFEISEPAVRSLLHRGRKALRREYAARGGTLPLGGLVPLAPSLIVLRGLGRLRSAARDGVKANVGTFAALSLVGALALGISFGALPSPVGTPPRDLTGPAAVAQGTSTAALTARLEAPTTTDTGTADPASRSANRLSPLDRVPKPCAMSDTPSQVCVTSGRSTGDVLYIGPKLPTNPVADRVGVGQNYVAVCDYLPATPVTECRKGSTRRSSAPHDLPPTSDTPSSIEGATP